MDPLRSPERSPATSGERWTYAILLVAVLGFFTAEVITAFADENLDEVVKQAGMLEVGYIPVVTRDRPRVPVGIMVRSDIIRAYGSVVPDFMARYLEQSMSFFMKQQKFLQGQVKSVVGTDPLSAMADMAQKNFTRLQSLQEEMLRGFTTDSDAPSDKGDQDSAEDRKRTG